MSIGFGCSEVAEIAPDLVARNKDGEIKTVYYDKVYAMLLNAVQKLTREKDSPADAVRKLESRLAELDSLTFSVSSSSQRIRSSPSARGPSRALIEAAPQVTAW